MFCETPLTMSLPVRESRNAERMTEAQCFGTATAVVLSGHTTTYTITVRKILTTTHFRLNQVMTIYPTNVSLSTAVPACVPRAIITDKLKSYSCSNGRSAAKRRTLPAEVSEQASGEFTSANQVAGECDETILVI